MMHNPAHPGELLQGWLEDLNTSVTAFAAHIGISRVMLSRVLHGRAAISSDLALRLERAGASTARAWLAMQANFDLAQAMQRQQPDVQPLDDKAA